MFDSAEEVLNLYGEKGIRVLAVLAEGNKEHEVTEHLSKEMQEEAVKTQNQLDLLKEEAEELAKQIDDNLKQAKLEVSKLRVKVADELGLHPMLPFWFNEDTETVRYSTELLKLVEGTPLQGVFKEAAEEVRGVKEGTSEESLVDFKEMLAKSKQKGSIH